jgi:hypothetical protein
MSNAATKLTALRERQARILAKIEQLETQAKKQARKDDTRLKILIGAAMLADAAIHPETEKFLRMVLVRAITAPRDQEFLTGKGWL